MQIVTGRRGEPHVTSRQMQAVYRSFLGDFALLDIGEKLRAEAYSDDIVRVYDGVVSVQGIYAVIAYNQYDEVYIEPVSVGKKRIDTIVLHYTKDNTLDVEDLQLDVVQGEEYTDNPIAPVVTEGGDAWEGTTDIQVPIYDVEVTNFGLTVTPYSRMLTVIPTLDSIAERIPETVVTGVKGDSEVLYRDGNVNITKANIGLGNVDNTADTDKPISTATQTALNLKADLVYVNAVVASAYHAGGNLTVAELTSSLLITKNMGKVFNMSDSGVTTSDFVEGAGEPINEGDNVGICNVGTEESPIYKFDLLSGFVDLSAYATTSAVNAGLAGKVDKVTGKGLSTEDYTTTDKTKLAGISEGATQTVANPADTATETLSKLEVGGVVYDIPQGASGATELSELTDVNLTDVEDNNILQYDETANKWKNSNALQGAKTATGNPLTITDAAPVNAVNLSMDLEPIQDLHGYDHPWVGGAGKNKLPMTVEKIKNGNTHGTWNGNVYSLNGVTFTILTDNNGNVTGVNVNGTTTSASVLDCTDQTIAISQPMIFNGCNNGSDDTYFLQAAGSPSIDLRDYGSGVNIPVGSTIGVRVYIRSGITLNNVEFKPMIRLATETDSTFAPYTNICPISGRTEENIIVSRPNLYIDGTIEFKEATAWTHDNTETAQSITGISASGNVINGTPSTGYFWMHIPFSFRKNRTVYLKFNETPATSMFRISNSNGQYITHIDTKDQYTPSEDFDGFIDLGYDSALFTNYKIGIGYTSTFDIDAYNEKPPKTYTIQIGQDVYGGTLDVTRGKMVIDRGYADLGDLNYTYESSWGVSSDFYTNDIQNAVKAPLNDSIIANVICSQYKIVSRNTMYNSTESAIAILTNGIMKIRDSRYTSASDFKTAVTGQQLVYELAEPFTIDLTPQQIMMLENTNTISTDYESDTITIEYQPNNAIGEAVRVVEESYDLEFAVRPVLKKKAFSGTTDTDGAVTLIDASDIPSNHRIIPLHITDMTIGGSAGTYFVEYKPYNSGDSVKGYCYTYFNGSQITPVGTVVTGNFYYYELEV